MDTLNTSNYLLMKQMMRPSDTQVPDFDPCQMLVNKKKQRDSGEMPPIKQIDPDDLFELEEFCKNNGIVGFNCGFMNPRAALKMLKSRMGIKEEPVANKKILLG
jgi:hypothetical protein